MLQNDKGLFDEYTGEPLLIRIAEALEAIQTDLMHINAAIGHLVESAENQSRNK